MRCTVALLALMALQGCGNDGKEGKGICQVSTTKVGDKPVEKCCKEGKPGVGKPSPKCCAEKDEKKVTECLKAEAEKDAKEQAKTRTNTAQTNAAANTQPPKVAVDETTVDPPTIPKAKPGTAPADNGGADLEINAAGSASVTRRDEPVRRHAEETKA